MNILVDANIWLDIILRRTNHFEPSAKVVSLLGRAEHTLYICAHSITTIFYLVEKARDNSTARTALSTLLQGTSVAAVDGSILREALHAQLSDYEDAVLEQAALRIGLDGIVTRNKKDFAGDQCAVYTPDELIAALLA